MTYEQQITTYQAMQQQVREDLYLKTARFQKGSATIAIVFNIIYTSCVNAIVSNADENSSNNMLIDFITKAQQVFYALLICEGYADYIHVSRRYNQLTDILFLVLHKYIEQEFVILLFSFLAYQFPNFQKDTCELSRTPMSDILLVPRLFNNNHSKNAIYHYYQTVLLSQFIMALIVGLQREIKKIAKINLKEHQMIMFVIITMLIFNIVKLIQISFSGGRFEQLQKYQFTQFYTIHIYMFGAYSASKIFVYKYNSQELIQEFEIHPTQTPIGSFIVKMCTSKLLLDIYMWALSQFSFATLLYKDQFVHEKLNFINRTIVFFLNDLIYCSIIALLQILYNIGQIQQFKERFDQNISMKSHWLIGSTIFTVIFNQYIFNGIVFGPYSTIMVIILTIGMGMEVFIFSSIFYYFFNSMYATIVNWVDVSGQNCAIFIIKIMNGKLISP